jgi:D-glycero-alpha-D-manno-heptose-7-phosphate kinase
MGREISVRCPVRIDLAGGWSDVPAYCNVKSGEVVNVAINHYVTAKKVIDQNRKMTVQYTTETPIGSGLGTSGAMNVALLATIAGEGKELGEIAELAFQFESLLGNTGGRQDQWASAFGGINHLTFRGDAVEIKRLNPSIQFCTWLQTHLLLFDTNIQHLSGQIHDNIWQKFHNHEQTVIQGLDLIRDAGLAMASAIDDEDSSQVVNSIRMVMLGIDLIDKKLHDPFRETLNPLEEIGSVLAWKAMGAGGGGIVGVLVKDSEHAKSSLIQATELAGWEHLQWEIEYTGIDQQS